MRHPDTFVTLEMKSAVEGTESTFVAEKSSSPEWNETFEFFCLQSQKGNVIGEYLNPFTPKFKKYILPTFLRSNV